MNGEMPRVRGLTLVEAWRGQRFSGLSVSKVSCPGFASRSIDVNRMTAFTLIELLVVVTIIVVLLALLTPALDRAIYRAELLRCGANQKGTGEALGGVDTDELSVCSRRTSRA